MTPELLKNLISKKFIFALVSMFFLNIQMFQRNITDGVFSTIFISIIVAYLAADVADNKVRVDALSGTSVTS